MTADATVLDRIFDRLTQTLSAGGPDQLRAPFTVAEIVQALVPYRTYRNDLGVDTLQDYEHAVLELLAGERGWLVCDPDTVAVIKRELASPDPDTGLLRRLHTVEVRVGAMRMPVTADVRKPIAFPEDDARDAAAEGHVRISDAVAIGAVMDREDAELATPVAPATATATAAATATSTATAAAAATAATLPSLADLPSLVPVQAEASPPPQATAAVTIANANTIARITPLSVPSVYGDPLDFRGVRHAPVDVGGVIFLFGMVARELGFHVEALSSGFPRCEAKRQISPGKWARVRIEFELESRQFRDAGRSPSSCDLIVCWRDTWPDRPSSLEVLPLDRALATLPARD